VVYVCMLFTLCFDGCTGCESGALYCCTGLFDVWRNLPIVEISGGHNYRGDSAEISTFG